MKSNTKKILIYSSGGLGDILVRIPHFRLIKQNYSEHRIIFLTNRPYTSASIQDYKSVFPNDIIDEIIVYNESKLKIINFFGLLFLLNKFKFDIIINLVLRPSWVHVFRDYLFFKSLFPNKMIGFKYLAPSITHSDRYESLWEPIPKRVAALLLPDLIVDLKDKNQWNILDSNTILSNDIFKKNGINVLSKYIVFSLGGKYEVQQWGDEKWRILLERISSSFPKIMFIAIGSSPEIKRCDYVLSNIDKNIFFNLCGKLSPKQSAYLIKNSILFVGQDSGPMHLASSVNKQSVVIHSSRTRPGEWFPFNGDVDNIYKKIECFGCYKEVCMNHQKKCIESITIEEIYNSVFSKIERC